MSDFIVLVLFPAFKTFELSLNWSDSFRVRSYLLHFRHIKLIKLQDKMNLHMHIKPIYMYIYIFCVCVCDHKYKNGMEFGNHKG